MRLVIIKPEEHIDAEHDEDESPFYDLYEKWCDDNNKEGHFTDLIIEFGDALLKELKP
jgi:hypothetical protein